MNESYAEFLERKTHRGADHGFEPTFMPDYLFDFQRSLTEWAILKGRSALFEDCGAGKTIQELVWAENVARHTDNPVLILAPIAVSAQTMREAERFGIECHRSQDGQKPFRARIVITNYERLGNFSPSDFSGVVCDESSILKSFDGAYKTQITDFMRKTPYRLLGTATAAPNDYIELGTSSEALGYLGFIDMLGRFFKNDNENIGMRRMYGEAPKWRFKGHAELPFWRWVASWARAMRKPSDLGFDDGGFKLPPLHEVDNLVEAKTLADGFLFNLPADTLATQREEKKRTIRERCERVAEITSANGHDQTVIWCQLNDEGDHLERILPDAVQVSGSDTDDKKEGAFLDFAQGNIKTLITKAKIGAWGMNWQGCHHVIYFPSHSYEQYYQAVRRCWRYGQKMPVTVDLVLTEGERKIMRNLQRKNLAAEKMFDNLVKEMTNPLHLLKVNDHTNQEVIPSWL